MKKIKRNKLNKYLRKRNKITREIETSRKITIKRQPHSTTEPLDHPIRQRPRWHKWVYGGHKREEIKKERELKNEQ